MYCAPAAAESFIKHVFALVAPAACEDATSANTCDLFPQSITLSVLPIENDSQIAAVDFECGYLVTPALTAMGGQNRLKTAVSVKRKERDFAVVETSTPRTKYGHRAPSFFADAIN